jgi:hypothetical protein
MFWEQESMVSKETMKMRKIKKINKSSASEALKGCSCSGECFFADYCSPAARFNSGVLGVGWTGTGAGGA